MYDKADRDDYLTHSSARLDKREEEENLVMDVVLKKEYDNGWLANAEAGYGTKDRYMARAFGMGYTEKFRLATFINANNTGDHTQGGTSGQWRGASSTENGMQDLLTAGMDYNYRNPDKVEASGSLTYKGEKDHNDDKTASTRFFESGDIFGRSVSSRLDKKHAISTQNSIYVHGSNVYFFVQQSLSWTRNYKDYDNMTATFTEPPVESYRGEAIDSIFASRASGDFSRYMLTRLREMTAGRGTNTKAYLGTGVTIRPKTWKGILSMSVNGSLNHNGTDTHTYYDQGYGPQSGSQNVPVRIDRFNPLTNDNRSISGQADYSQDFRSFGENRTITKNFGAGITYNHNNEKLDNQLYTADYLPDPLTPPSTVMPEGLVIDRGNSPHTALFKNSFGANIDLGYSSEPSAPGDSTFNATYGVKLILKYRHDHDNYHYLKTDITNQRVSRNNDFITPMLMLNLSSSNKSRNIYSVITYSVNHTAPQLSYLIDTYDSSNPLNIFTGNPNGLKNAIKYEVMVEWMRFGRGASKSRLSVYGRWQVITNSTAMAQRYNPATGVTVNTPENISGNWSAWLMTSASASFGRARNLTLSGTLYVDVTNSADYNAINATPTRSSVLTHRYRPTVQLDYTTKNGSTLTAGFTTVIESQRSDRENFNNMTWFSYWPFVRAFLKLPAGLELNTQFNPYFRRGFTDSAMNTSEYVWNATLSKTFTRPAITLRFTANDILGSAKHVYTSVNAQGRTETWRYCMPRYVMLTVGYRFDMKPRSGKGVPSRGRGIMMY